MDSKYHNLTSSSYYIFLQVNSCSKAINTNNI